VGQERGWIPFAELASNALVLNRNRVRFRALTSIDVNDIYIKGPRSNALPAIQSNANRIWSAHHEPRTVAGGPRTIPLHAFAAMAAFALGIVQFAAPKGTLPHRTIGWIWVVLMATVAASSLWIHEIRLLGPWSPIHLLSIFTLIVLPIAAWRARRHRVADHRRIMTMIFAGALVIAGLFTFLPGRIMHAVVFGH
jgi:uncharacterized membrane protein